MIRICSVLLAYHPTTLEWETPPGGLPCPPPGYLPAPGTGLCLLCPLHYRQVLYQQHHLRSPHLTKVTLKAIFLALASPQIVTHDADGYWCWGGELGSCHDLLLAGYGIAYNCLLKEWWSVWGKKAVLNFSSVSSCTILATWLSFSVPLFPCKS